MFDLGDPRSWTNFTNWVLVAVALIAAGYIGFGILRQKFGRRTNPAQAFSDAHTLFLPDLGITMADGGEKVHEAKVTETKTSA